MINLGFFVWESFMKPLIQESNTEIRKRQVEGS